VSFEFANSLKEQGLMSSVPKSLSKVNWDNIGIAASTLCAIHCLLLPIVLAFAPTLAHFLPGDETVHRTLAYLRCRGTRRFLGGLQGPSAKAGAASLGYWNSRRYRRRLRRFSVADPRVGSWHHRDGQLVPDRSSLFESYFVPLLSSLR
jgi:hypothetical protein